MGNRGPDNGLAFASTSFAHLLQHGARINMLGAQYQKIPQPVEKDFLRGHRLKIVQRAPSLASIRASTRSVLARWPTPLGEASRPQRVDQDNLEARS